MTMILFPLYYQLMSMGHDKCSVFFVSPSRLLFWIDKFLLLALIILERVAPFQPIDEKSDKKSASSTRRGMEWREELR